MSRKKTHEEYVEQVHKVNPKIVVVGKYINARTAIPHICSCGRDWMAIPYDVLKGVTCRTCMGERLSNSQRSTLEEYKEKVKMLPIHKVECTSEVYIKSNVKIKHKCLICGRDLWMTPNKVLGGRGCRECSYLVIAEKKTVPYDVFVNRLQQVNPAIEITSEYKGITKPLSGVCNVCGNPWHVSKAEQMLRDSNCPICNYTRMSKDKMLTNEEFLSRVNSNILVLEEYKGPSVLLPVKCKTCGYEWDATVGSLLRPTKYGCARCSGRIKTHEDYIEEVSISNPTITILSKYQGADKPIECKCNVCGHIWTNNRAVHICEGVGCPLCNQSRGEKRILSYLQINDVSFIAQKVYKDLMGVKGSLLSYDFYIPEHNLLIEYQGEQHEHFIDGFTTEQDFKQQLEHDKRKREYAKNNGINLLEIWYHDYDNIEIILNKELNLNSETLTTAGYIQ